MSGGAGAGAGAGGAGAGSGAGAGAGGSSSSGGGTPSPWALDSVQGEDRTFLEGKYPGGLGELTKAYRNLEKHLGVPREKLMRLPDDGDAAGWAEFYGRTGRPEKPEGYGVEGADAELLTRAHAAGLSTAQVKALATYLGERQAAEATRAEEARAQQGQLDEQALRTEWGAKFDENIIAGKRGAQALGLDAAALDRLEAGMGTRGMLEHLARIGRGLGEQGFVGSENGAGGGASGFGMTPQAAQLKFTELSNDHAFMDRVRRGDSAALTEWNRIAGLAYPAGTAGGPPAR
jgi:hypothetical protein